MSTPHASTDRSNDATASSHLAIDYGAGSGRAMLGLLGGEPKELRLTEVHRFEHAPLPTPAGPVWDLTGLWRELLTGLRLGARAGRPAGQCGRGHLGG